MLGHESRTAVGWIQYIESTRQLLIVTVAPFDTPNTVRLFRAEIGIPIVFALAPCRADGGSGDVNRW